MILKDLLNSQKSIFKEFKRKNKEIFDIVIFGSLARGKEDIRDIDIAIILNELRQLSFKLKLAQSLRHALKFKNINLDVKTFDFKDFQDKSFLARQGIILEGFSITKNRFLSELFGFSSYSLFIYTLKGLSASKKRSFSYILKGRYSHGLIKTNNIEQLGKGVIKVPIQHTEELIELFDYHKISYKIKYCLIPYF